MPTQSSTIPSAVCCSCCRCSWASIPEWEAWNLSEQCRRSHLPWGVYQWVPGKGEGFPEDFVPFLVSLLFVVGVAVVGS